MNSVCLHTRGGPEALVYEQAPTPQPGVRVHAANGHAYRAAVGADVDNESRRAPPIPRHSRTRVFRRSARPGAGGGWSRTETPFLEVSPWFAVLSRRNNVEDRPD